MIVTLIKLTKQKNCRASNQIELNFGTFKKAKHSKHFNTPVGVEHLIALLTPQRFQIPLIPRMFPIWDFMVGIFARKALLNMGWVLSILCC